MATPHLGERSPGIVVRELAIGMQRKGYKDVSWWFNRARGQILGHFPIELAQDRAEWRQAIHRRCEGNTPRWHFGGRNR